MDATTRTPQPSPARRVATITQAQKQALVDNLQLEITERARKLRAQYAEQAQGLRTRLDIRVNRIPQALRRRNIQEVVDEHHAKSKPAPPPPPPMPVAAQPQPTRSIQPMPNKSQPALKRKSDDISIGDDKENMPTQTAHDLPNPKKRTKTAVTANSKATRARTAGPAVLSPRSHNSRNLPQSPTKPMEKTHPPRPMSSAQTTAKPTRAPSRQTKRPGTTSDTDRGRTSDTSDTSAGTTIITKPGIRKAAMTKKSAPPKAATTSRKPTTAKPVTAPPAAATRTLRSRN